MRRRLEAAGQSADEKGRKVRIYGKGLARRRHVGIDDVAEAVVRLALADDPPRAIDLAGPEPMSASEAADAYERALGRPLKRSDVPRLVMRVGRTLMRPNAALLFLRADALRARHSHESRQR